MKCIHNWLGSSHGRLFLVCLVTQSLSNQALRERTLPILRNPFKKTHGDHL